MQGLYCLSYHLRMGTRTAGGMAGVMVQDEVVRLVVMLDSVKVVWMEVMIANWMVVAWGGKKATSLAVWMIEM